MIMTSVNTHHFFRQIHRAARRRNDGRAGATVAFASLVLCFFICFYPLFHSVFDFTNGQRNRRTFDK